MQPPLPPTAPHYYGLIAALAGAGLLIFALTRPEMAARLGKRRGLVAAAGALALVALALFGSGVYGTAGRGSAWTGALLASGLPFSTERVERALEVGLSDDFIDYHARLSGLELTIGSQDLESVVRWEWTPYVDNGTYYGTMPSPYPVGGQALVYHYHDTHNYAFELFGVGTDEMDQRHAYWQEFVHEYLDELIALEYIANAQNPEERIAALGMLRTGVSDAAEWILRALDRLPADALSPAERAALAQTRAHAQMYIDDPTMRALPASRRVTLDGP